MLRMILGIVAGMVAFTMVVMSFQFVSLIIYPFPEGLSPGDPEAMKKHIAALPAMAFVLILSGYAVGSLVAGLLSSKIANSASILPPLLLGIFFTIGWVINTMSLPHPVWAVVAGYFMYIPFTFLGHRLGSN